MMVSVIVLVSNCCLGFEETLAAGFGATATFVGGEQTPTIQRSAASADRGMLASKAGLGQLTGAITAAGFAAGFATTVGAFFGAGFF
jgi:hypothetical protein